MLTAEQQAHFETFGSIVLREAFSADEIGAITREFDDALAADRQGHRSWWLTNNDERRARWTFKR